MGEAFCAVGRGSVILRSMWTSSSGSMNDEARRRVAAVRRRQRPDNEVPISVAVDAVLAESPDFVVYMSGIRVFRAVLEFRLTALARYRDVGRRVGGGLFGRDPEDRLLLGIEYADGRAGSNVGGFHVAADQNLDPDTPVLMPGGGGGGDRSADMAYCLSPLPPPGPLRIITAWPARNLPETVTEMSADPFTAAAARVRVLWEPEPDEPPARPSPPAVPPGSWFDRRTH